MQKNTKYKIYFYIALVIPALALIGGVWLQSNQQAEPAFYLLAFGGVVAPLILIVTGVILLSPNINKEKLTSLREGMLMSGLYALALLIIVQFVGLSPCHTEDARSDLIFLGEKLNINSYIAKASSRVGRAVADIRQIQNALELGYNDGYPDSLAEINIEPVNDAIDRPYVYETLNNNQDYALGICMNDPCYGDGKPAEFANSDSVKCPTSLKCGEGGAFCANSF